MLFRIKDYYDYVLSILGNNSITVDLVKEDLQQALQFTIAFYNKYRPKVSSKILTYSGGQREYKLKYEDVFRGIIDVVFEETTGVVVTPFPREYYPWTGLSAVRANTIAEWYSYQDGFRGVFGVTNRWYYDKDSRTLRVFNKNGSRIKYYFIQDRYLFEKSYNVTTSTFTVLLEDNYRRLYNVLPESIFIVLPNGEVYVNDIDNQFVSSSGNVLGTFDPNTSQIALTFPGPLNGSITIEVNEVRSSDFHWFSRYLLGQLANILVSKRTRFGGTLTSIDIGDVSLDVEVLNRYAEEIKTLETECQKWMLDWVLPRSK
jgi:hypothetical protein